MDLPAGTSIISFANEALGVYADDDIGILELRISIFKKMNSLYLLFTIFFFNNYKYLGSNGRSLVLLT